MMNSFDGVPPGARLDAAETSTRPRESREDVKLERVRGSRRHELLNDFGTRWLA